MSKNHNEKTRVQVPAILHLTRLCYKYFGKIHEETAGEVFDSETNILIGEFQRKFAELNPDKKNEWHYCFSEIKKKANDNDLGRGFYKMLISSSPYKLIDFDNPKNNSFYVTGEFTCKNGEDEFRPDITLFINGLPLVFIEVKKPNNHEGMVAEYKRLYAERMPKSCFRRFFNITQLMIFSNNMEYDALGGIVPVQGSFYCTGSRTKPFFNCFREENPQELAIAPFIAQYPYLKDDEQTEKQILKDFNCQVIFHQNEYQTNKDFNRPTNRILTSMCSPERLLYLLRYGIVYVNSTKEKDDGTIETIDEKHIMRYQQFFASMAIKQKLDEGVKSGIIWHTQGSGKTALSYYINKILSDYYATKNKVAKFYFIVDRIDLMEQAKTEFESRGLKVATASTRDELMTQFRENKAKESNSGEYEITVVNIQRFAEDKEKVVIPEYATNLQRVFIIDEAHRGYDPKGCFLANLLDADKNAIKIALTGTPLLKEEKASWTVFGDYIHTYYYDKSIADGYTVKLIREDIETSYKEKLLQVQETVRRQIESDNKNSLDELVLQKEVKKADIIEHEVYVKELLRYIIKDFVRFRKIQGDESLGGMIVAETGPQAKKIAEFFDEIMNELIISEGIKPLKANLILHDIGTKEERKQIIQKDYKENATVDILIVFNMLLTGFDAPRLKKLYLGRKLKDHNLLQAITRVNRPYKDMPKGYLVDFADIKANFDDINEQYLKELNKFNDSSEVDIKQKENILAQIIESPEQIIHNMKVIKQTLFRYDTSNLEEFSNQINQIEEKDELLELKNALEAAKSMANLVRTLGDDELKNKFEKVKIEKVSDMLREVQNHIDLINQKNAFAVSDETKILINEAMLNIKFNFAKIGEEELKIISAGKELEEKRKRALHEFEKNIDPEDPEFITLRDAFLNRFKQRGFVPNSLAEFNEENKDLDDIINRLKKLNGFNSAIANKYDGDEKFARIHKRIVEENKVRYSLHKNYLISEFEDDIAMSLMQIKTDIDQRIFDRNNILKKDSYFADTVYAIVDNTLYKMNIESEYDDCEFIKNKISRQYMNQYQATYGVQNGY